MSRKIVMSVEDLKLIRNQIEHEDRLEKKLKAEGLNEEEAREWRVARHWTEKSLYAGRHDLLALADIGRAALYDKQKFLDELEQFIDMK